MDKVTADKLERIAPLLEKFLELHPDDQQLLFPLLGRAEKRAIEILECCQGGYVSYEEIAKASDTHINTVKQTLYALSRGGLSLSQNKSGKWMTPKGGRYRRLTKID